MTLINGVNSICVKTPATPTKTAMKSEFCLLLCKKLNMIKS